MPNRNTHDLVGASTAGIAGLALAKDQSPEDCFVEAIGAVVAGVLGSRLPDGIDPPTYPGHRSLGHGVVPVGSVATWYFRNLPGWHAELRCLARSHAEAAARAPTDGERLAEVLMEVCFRLAAGAVVGLAFGYISHLVIDAGTRRGLPLAA